jgi:2,4-dienoyl-CoA reductase (NADPH2)
MILSPVSSIELLRAPLRVGPLMLKNRMCMPAMHLNFTPGGEVTDQLVRFYAERARGGVALITVGGCSVDAVGGGPLMIGLNDDRFIPGLRRLTDVIHEGGAHPVAQLYQAGSYAYSMLTGQQPVSASAVRSKLTGETPRALTLEEIDQVQQAFADAAARAVEAGFAGVEVLASAGYLISQFLSPSTNRREDRYGGSFENRARFGRETIERVRAAVGPGVLVAVRVAGADFVPGGHDNSQSARASKVFVGAGADAVNVTGGWHETRVPQLTMGVPRGAFIYLAAGIRAAVDVPVIASNRISDPFMAEAVLRDGLADLINFGRPLIADPELPQKVAKGWFDRIVHCVACNQGCFDHVFAAKPVACMVNPAAGREDQALTPAAPRPRSVLVVGGGPGGMMAATTAARRGHRVTLLERSPRLGGQLALTERLSGRPEMATMLGDLTRQLSLQPVEIRLSTEASPEVVRELDPDTVIVATGAKPITPAIEGADLPHVAQAWDVLSGKARVGERVVVIGGGAVAVDTALDLAQRGTLDGETLRFLLLSGAEEPDALRERCLRGSHQVTLVEMEKKIGRGIGKTTRWTLTGQLKAHGVELRGGTTASRITDEGVWVSTEDEYRLIPADSVVLAVGAEPVSWLAEALGEEREVVLIGDAKAPRRAFEAIHEGFQAAMEI